MKQISSFNWHLQKIDSEEKSDGFRKFIKMREIKRILIVDDEPYNILSLNVFLQQSGYKKILRIVDIAHNG